MDMAINQVVGQITVEVEEVVDMVEVEGMVEVEEVVDASMIEIVTIPKNVMEEDAHLLMAIALAVNQTKNVCLGDVCLMITQAADQIVIARTMKHATEEFV